MPDLPNRWHIAAVPASTCGFEQEMTMDIAPLSTTGGKTGSASSSPVTADADYQTFLKMLTVQMQNQDPLNPIDSSDYAVQLATFSGVEQQIRTNQLLDALSGQFDLVGLAQMAGWIGQEARTTAPVVFTGEPVTLSPDPASGASRAVLVATDALGRVVSREDIPVTARQYDWLGGDATGSPLPAGPYTLTLESYSGDTLLRSDPVQSYARITEARVSDAGVILVLDGGAEVAASDVTALRSP
jgi:flagellar basal-body rod modification protein FlgD